MHKKKIIFERRFRKTKRRIVIGILLFCIGNILLLVLAGWLIIFHRPNIVSPVSISAQQNKSTTIDPQFAVNQTKSLLSKYNISFQSVDQTGDTIKIQLSDDSQALLTTNKNPESQIASLQLALNQFTIEGKKFKKLDFRFDKPVVSF